MLFLDLFTGQGVLLRSTEAGCNHYEEEFMN